MIQKLAWEFKIAIVKEIELWFNNLGSESLITLHFK